MSASDGPTGPYSKVFRKPRPRRVTAQPTSDSDVYPEPQKVPLVTSIKNLELFAEALQNFGAAQSKSMVQARRYKTSTVVMSVVLGMVLTRFVYRELNAAEPDLEAQAEEIAKRIEEGIEAGVAAATADRQAIDETKATPSQSRSKPTRTSAETGLASDRAIAALVELQILQTDYLVEVLASSAKRRNGKPPALVQAEDRARSAIRRSEP